jgi:hypothetical protein
LAVYDHLGVEPAVRAEVNVLEERASNERVDFCPDLVESTVIVSGCAFAKPGTIKNNMAIAKCASVW